MQPKKIICRHSIIIYKYVIIVIQENSRCRKNRACFVFGMGGLLRLAARPAVSPVARTVGRCSVGMCRDGVRVPPVRAGRGQTELI